MTTFQRLLGFLSPYRRGLSASWGLASVAMVGTVALPALRVAASKRSSGGRSPPSTTKPPPAPTSDMCC